MEFIDLKSQQLQLTPKGYTLREDIEKRISPADGKEHTYLQFLEWFGAEEGEIHWEEAKKTILAMVKITSDTNSF